VPTQFSADGNELLDALADAISMVEDEPLVIAEHASFDAAYAVLLNFSSIGTTERARGAELIISGLTGVTKACKRSLTALASDAEIGQLREALKKAVFLQSHLIQEAEKVAAAVGAPAVAVKGRSGRSGATKKGAAQQSMFEWAALRETAVARLLESLELDLGTLWCRRAPDEALLQLLTQYWNTWLLSRPRLSPSARHSGA